MTLYNLCTISLSFFNFLIIVQPLLLLFFFFNDTATTEIYTLSLHDALPISAGTVHPRRRGARFQTAGHQLDYAGGQPDRSEEHTSELQSRLHLVCRLLLEKKKKKKQRKKNKRRTKNERQRCIADISRSHAHM